jgi:predicted transposase YdaD
VKYDNVCKYLAEEYPSDFAAWLLSTESPKVRVLNAELSLEPIQADYVTFLQTREQILHLEFQTSTPSNPPMPFRMLDYSVRLKRLYRQQDIEQVVVFLKETTNPIAFTQKYRDRTTVHRYRVIRMWEEETEPFLNNPALLPLAPLTRSDSPPNLLARVASRVATIEDVNQQRNLAGCTEILAGLRFEKELIRQLFREEIMRESVIYQDIIQRGEQRGEQREALSLAFRLLNRKLGGIDESFGERVRSLSTEQLEALAEALLDFSTTENLANWLQENE